MAAGDIITSKGYIFTPEDVEQFVSALVEKINSTAKDPSEYDLVTALDDTISSLPVFKSAGNSLKLVRIVMDAFRGAPFTYEDFTPEQLEGLALKFDNLPPDLIQKLKLKLGELTPEDIALLQQPATEAAADTLKVRDEVKLFGEAAAKAEAERVKTEELRVTAETGRVNIEKERVTTEGLRDDAEELRDDSEAERLQAERLRNETEASRVLTEGSRATEESKRKTAEDIRLQSEKNRTDEEGKRVEAERQRAANEILRTQTETNRDKAESLRNEAETARAITEADREMAETLRENNEGRRFSTEKERVDAETIRSENEDTRIVEEQLRKNTEQTRKEAEAGRVIAEEEREANTTQAILNTEAATTKADTATKRANDAAAAAENIVSGIRPDWNVTDPTSNNYIANKPDIPEWALKPDAPTSNDYTDKEKAKLGKINFVPTLDHEPGENDLAFTDGDGNHTFLIGNQARVLNAEKGEYVFWQLYDIAAGKAVWKKAGSGGDMQLTEKVNITLSSNQAQPDSALNGAVIHLVYGDNDTPLTWNNGTVLSAEIPFNMKYRIVYPDILGYATPETTEYVAILGNTRTVNTMYNTSIMTIDIASNQTDKAALNNLQIVLSGSVSKTLTYTGQPLTLKVPTGKQITITPTQVEGYATVSAVSKTPTTAIDSVTFAYNTTVTSISLTSNQGADTALNGLSVTVAYSSVTKNLTWQGSVLSLKIPTGVSYTVTTGAVTGYNIPAPKTQTAVGTTGSVSMAYTTERVTINVTADDGASVDGQTLTVTKVSDGSVIYSGAAGTVVLKIPLSTLYRIAVNAKVGYKNVAAQDFTASQVSRTVSAVYERIKSSQIIFDKSISDPSNISGDVNTGVIKEILSKFRRCLCKKTAEGEVSIAYLKNDNSNFYEDGTPAVLNGSEGDMMVYKPEYYYKYEKIDDVKFAYRLSYLNEDGTYIHSPESLIGAKKSYSTSSKLYSRSGVTPTANQTIVQFGALAKARGAGYQLIDYEQHCMIALMFYAKYGNRDSQAVLGAGGASERTTTGSTDTIGNTDTVKSFSSYVNFLGIEGVFGGIYEFVTGVAINNKIWTITNPDKTTRSVNAHTSDGWISNIAAENGTYFDVIPIAVGGSETTLYADYFYFFSVSEVLVRSCNVSDLYGGVACTNVRYNNSDERGGVGSRLAFRGVIREALSVAAFKAIPITN